MVKKAEARMPPLEFAHWNVARLERLLRAWRGKRVLVIGDVGVDRYVSGIVERISPEAPVPIVWVREEQLKLGLAANVADNVRALSGEPWLFGVVGRDHFARKLRVLLREARVPTRHLTEDPSRPTVLKERIVSERQQLLRVDYESLEPMAPSVVERVIKAAQAQIPHVDAVVLEDYAKGLVTPEFAARIFATARRAGKPVLVDPNLKTPLERYRGASLLTPNTKEAEWLSGIAIRDEETLCAARRKLLALTKAEHVVITRGKEGMAIFARGRKKVTLIPTYAREVYDVSGAGDTVIAVLALALSAGANMEEACVLGNLAAGVEVGKRGTATVSPEEVLAAMHTYSPSSA